MGEGYNFLQRIRQFSFGGEEVTRPTDWLIKRLNEVGGMVPECRLSLHLGSPLPGTDGLKVSYQYAFKR